jgi:hypothetical protein
VLLVNRRTITFDAAVVFKDTGVVAQFWGRCSRIERMPERLRAFLEIAEIESEP